MMNRDWRKALMIMGAGGGILALLFVALAAPLSNFVTGGKLAISLPMSLALGCLIAVMALHQPSAVLLTSPSLLKFQAVCASLMLVLNLGLSVYLTPLVGPPGVVWASVMTVFAAQLVPCAIKAKAQVSAADTRGVTL